MKVQGCQRMEQNMVAQDMTWKKGGGWNFGMKMGMNMVCLSRLAWSILWSGMRMKWCSQNLVYKWMFIPQKRTITAVDPSPWFIGIWEYSSVILTIINSILTNQLLIISSKERNWWMPPVHPFTKRFFCTHPKGAKKAWYLKTYEKNVKYEDMKKMWKERRYLWDLLLKDNWLVVSNTMFSSFHIWDVILPIEALTNSYSSRWLLHHQADI